MKKRNWLRAALGLTAAYALTHLSVMAQAYPNRPASKAVRRQGGFEF
jgi:hypothetical protein